MKKKKKYNERAAFQRSSPPQLNGRFKTVSDIKIPVAIASFLLPSIYDFTSLDLHPCGCFSICLHLVASPLHRHPL